MSTFNCSVWVNSGFNAVNIPDSPTLLQNMAHTDFPVLDLNQERFLGSVRIRASWNQVKDADYCRVGDFFYSVSNVFMSSGDVAVLSLTPDFVTSAGGPATLHYLDGITNRVHVKDDTFGIYAADDPYMAPAYDMDIQSQTFDFSNRGRYTFMETTLNLVLMGNQYEDYEGPAVSCIVTNSDPDAEVKEVTVPIATPLAIKTEYSLNFDPDSAGVISLSSPDAQGIYRIDSSIASYATVQKGVAFARSLGVEDSISGQYTVPEPFVQISSDTAAFMTAVTGKTGQLTANSIPFKYSAVVTQNNRVWYGSQTPYVLATTAGNSVSANAEEIYDGNSTAPKVRYYADPRRTGKPYYRFDPLNGQSSKGLDFFRNCVAGTEWRAVPMTFTEKSGSILDRINFENSVVKANLERDMESAKNTRAFIRDAGIAAGTALGALANPVVGLPIFAGAVGNMIGGEITREVEFKDYQKKFALDRAMELQSFMISQSVNVPTVNFTPDPALFSEVANNGCSVYRIVYKDADIQRIDKILTAFGYKHSKVLEASDFTGRQYFNYVEASVSVGNLPGWWANGIAVQLSNGVRVWHVKPNAAHYASNPIV